MEIEYKGANNLVFKTSAASLIVDPKLPISGQKEAKIEGAIEVLTQLSLGLAQQANPKILIDGPGEYEVSGISIKGMEAKSHYNPEVRATVYRLDIAGFRIAVLGHVQPILSETQLESLGVIDIVTLPVGGNDYTLDAHEAAAIVRQIDPKIVIPTSYADSTLKYEVVQDSLESFLKELGAAQYEVVDKLKMKSGTPVPAILTVCEIKRT